MPSYSIRHCSCPLLNIAKSKRYGIHAGEHKSKKENSFSYFNSNEFKILYIFISPFEFKQPQELTSPIINLLTGLKQVFPHSHKHSHI